MDNTVYIHVLCKNGHLQKYKLDRGSTSEALYMLEKAQVDTIDMYVATYHDEREVRKVIILIK